MTSLFSHRRKIAPADAAPSASAAAGSLPAAPAVPAVRGAAVEDLVLPALKLAHASEMMVALQGLPGTPAPNLLAWERCRVLRTHIAQLARDRNLRTLLVTSAVAGEGKSLLSANIALSFSLLEDKRVLLIDADLRKPSLSAFFGLEPALGLSDCLQDGKGIRDVRQRLHPNLDLVPTRSAFEDSVELLNRRRMRELLAEAAAYDLVIVDSPPMSPIADTQVLARLVDGALLIVRAGVAHFALVRQAAELLQPKLLGAVLNGVAGDDHGDYFYRYYRQQDGGTR